MTNAIFIVRQMQEKFRAKGKKLYFGFVDLLTVSRNTWERFRVYLPVLTKIFMKTAIAKLIRWHCKTVLTFTRWHPVAV